MTIMSSHQAGALIGQQQAYAYNQMAYASALGQVHGGYVGSSATPPPGATAGPRLASAAMGALQHAPQMATAAATVGALGMGAAGMLPMSAGGAAVGGVLGGALGGPVGLLGGAALGALPLSLGLGIPAAAAAGAYGVSQVGRGYSQYRQTSQALGGYNFYNPGAQGGQGFSGAQARQVTSMMRDIGTQMNMDIRDLAGIAAALPEMGMMQAVRDAQDFQRKFKDIVSATKEVASVMGVSLQEAIPFFQDMRRSGFYTAQDVMGATVQRQVLGTMGYGTQQFNQLQRGGASLAQAFGSRRATGAGLTTRLAGSLGAAVQSGAISEEAIMEATGGMTGPAAYNQLSMRMAEQAFRFATTPVGRAMMLATGEVEDGRYTGEVDMGQIARLRAGDINIRNVRGEASRRLGGGRGSRVSFVANEELLRGNLMEQAGPELIESVVRDVAGSRGIAGAEEDIEMLLMKRFTNLNRAEAEVMVEMAREAATIRRTQRERTLQAVDNAINQAEQRKRGIRGWWRQNVGREWEAQISNPLQELGQGLGGGIEERSDRFFDRLWGRYDVTITEQERQAWMMGTGMGDVAGLTAMSTGRGLGRMGAANRQLRRGQITEGQFGQLQQLEQRRAGFLGGLTAADVGLGRNVDLSQMGSEFGEALGGARWSIRARTAGNMSARRVQRGLRGTGFYEEYLQGRPRQEREDIVRLAAQQGGVTLPDDDYGVGAMGLMAARGREEVIDEAVQTLGRGSLGNWAYTGPAMSLVAPAMTAVQYGGGWMTRMYAGLISGESVGEAAKASLTPWAYTVGAGMMHAPMRGKVRDLLTGDSSTQVMSWLGSSTTVGDKFQQTSKYRNLLQKEEDGTITGGEKQELRRFREQIGDLTQKELRTLQRIIQDNDPDQVKAMMTEAGMHEATEVVTEFQNKANRQGAALSARISKEDAARHGVDEATLREIRAYASELEGLSFEDAAAMAAGEVAGPGGADLARLMRGMGSGARGDVMAYLGSLGPEGEVLAAGVGMRMQQGQRRLGGIGGTNRDMVLAQIASRSGVDVQGLMRSMETREGGPESAGRIGRELYYELEKSIRDLSISDTEGQKLADMLAVAQERGAISGASTGGARTGTLSGDVVELAQSIERAMEANTIFVRAVGEELPKLREVTELTEQTASPGAGR